MSWGILSPDTVISQRRQQGLGLAAAVRHFNDRAVPGLGGLWFPMPLLWSVLAVSIAEELGRPALPIGNAVEALMMRDAKGGPADRRVRGARKMQGMTDWSFQNLTRNGTYIAQPIRMAMVQPLVALGLVQGSRYGAFRLHDAGRQMLALPGVADSRAILIKWARGEDPQGLKGLNDLIKQLSPIAQVPAEVRKLIQARLLDGDEANTIRRRNIARLGTGPSTAQLDSADPLPGIDPSHWADLRAGAAFIDLRDGALKVLNRIEQVLLQRRDASQPVRLFPRDAGRETEAEMAELHRIANAFGSRIDAAKEPVSSDFLKQIRTRSAADLCQFLAARDGTVVVWRGDHLALGPAAGAPLTNADPDTEAQPTGDAAFAPQLFRLYNLHCLTTELSGQINPGCRDAKDQEVA